MSYSYLIYMCGVGGNAGIIPCIMLPNHTLLSHIFPNLCETVYQKNSKHSKQPV